MLSSEEPRDKSVFATRPAVVDDQGYVCKTWVESVLDNDHCHRATDARKRLNLLVNRLLDDPATVVRIAYDPDEDRNPDEDHEILGWIAYSAVGCGRTLLYINVRHQHRRQSIATMLANAAGFDDECATVTYLFDGPSARWLKPKWPHAIKVEPELYLKA